MILTQIRALINLTPGSQALFPGSLRKFSTWLGCASSVVLIVGSASVSSAQSSSGRQLPPPPLPKSVTPAPVERPPVAPKNEVITPIEVSPVAPKASQPIREYTFQAPQTLPAENISETETETIPTVLNVEPVSTNIQPVPQTSQSNENPSFYRVEVVGNQDLLLSQVKMIEPMAFIRQSEGVIHAGMFQNSQQAQQRVQALQKQGLTANIVPVYRGEKRSLLVQTKP
ncbi:hypothetical protein [Crocosphaera sp. XPORK-15E]|uniref:hypothetical protein n=1 Tax=Crocosphaera sp. XPORK-15E TaxID=3110247 RepID=UPI002B1F6DBA|nr:hypothetical protein [Crocosphaera sp. XPORK-15E]MEA5534800.1 hypothetical protein [Crocosphaera sp. XPORK-15E]